MEVLNLFAKSRGSAALSPLQKAPGSRPGSTNQAARQIPQIEYRPPVSVSISYSCGDLAAGSTRRGTKTKSVITQPINGFLRGLFQILCVY
jgi:hypothetical protein